MDCTRDPQVIEEWSRRKSDYAARSRWLRIPFYSAIGLLVTGSFLLPTLLGLVLIGVGVAGFLSVGIYLSRYSYSSLKCPHCEKRPFNLYNTRMSWDHCRQCGYWLLDVPRPPNKSLERTRER
jgi:hypothetical protein